MMILDTAGNNDTGASEEIENKHQSEIVEQMTFLRSLNTICFVFRNGGSRIYRTIPHVMGTMSTALNAGFENHTSFLQTHSSSFSVSDFILLLYYYITVLFLLILL